MGGLNQRNKEKMGWALDGDGGIARIVSVGAAFLTLGRSRFIALQPDRFTLVTLCHHDIAMGLVAGIISGSHAYPPFNMDLPGLDQNNHL